MVVMLDANRGREIRKENTFLSTKVCFYQLELAVRLPLLSLLVTALLWASRVMLYVKETMNHKGR